SSAYAVRNLRCRCFLGLMSRGSASIPRVSKWGTCTGWTWDMFTLLISHDPRPPTKRERSARCCNTVTWGSDYLYVCALCPISWTDQGQLLTLREGNFLPCAALSLDDAETFHCP